MRIAQKGILRAALVVWAGLCAAVSAGTARAEDIAQIELTRNGPKSLLPLQKPFYLKLAPTPDISAAQIVFVRYAYRPFGRHPRRTEGQHASLDRRPPVSCSEVQRSLAELQPELQVSMRIPAGVQQIEKIWQVSMPSKAADAPTPKADVTPKTDAEVADALRAADEKAATDREERLARQNFEHLKRYGRALVIDTQAVSDERKTLAFLVHSPGFFVDGAAYCMFVYERRNFSVSEELYKALREAVVVSVPTGQLGDVNVPDTAVDAMYKAFAANKEISKKVDAKTETKLKDLLAQDLLAIGWKLAWVGSEVRARLAQWQIARSPELPGVGRTLEIAADPFALLLAELLTYHGHLAVKREDGKATFSFNGKSYDKIRVIGDLEGVELVASPPPAGRPGRTQPAPALDKTAGRPPDAPASAAPAIQRLSVAILSLKLPESTATLKDVVELSRGALPVGDRFLASDSQELQKAFKDELKLDQNGPALSPNAKKLSGYMDTMHEVLKRAFAAKATRKSGPDFVYTPLGLWLHSSLKTCQDLGGKLKPPKCGASDAESWPGVDGSGSPDPVSDLRSRLATYFDTLDAWDGFKKVLATKAENFKSSESYPVTSLTLEFSTDSWASSHITPVVGGAGIITAAQSFMIPYVGVQVFAWPNPVDQPMWTHGAADLRRLFGVELGLGIPRTGRSGFGPDDRYRNTGLGLPPVLLGLAIQPIPYVTTSVGVAFMRVKRSTLGAEIDQPYQALYINFSFQLNIINAVRKLFSGGGYAEARKIFQ